MELTFGLLNFYTFYLQGGKSSGFRGHQQEVQQSGKPRLFQVHGFGPDSKKALEVIMSLASLLGIVPSCVFRFLLGLIPVSARLREFDLGQFNSTIASSSNAVLMRSQAIVIK